MGREDEEAYVTLTADDVYAVGALVLAHSLRLSGATRKLVCMLTPEGVSPFYRSALGLCFDELVDVASAGEPTAGSAPHERPDVAAKFAKLQCWTLVQYRKCVFLDADTLVLQNCDDLFDRAELSACPDPGWPDFFNTGVFVFTPSRATYESLLQFARTNEGCCEGGEQGLLNSYFKDWPWSSIARHLPFVYNVIPQSFYSYQPALRRFAPGVKICHFAGYAKPWHRSVDARTGRVIGGGSAGCDYLQQWWDVLSEYVLPLFKRCAEVQQPSLTDEAVAAAAEAAAVAVVPAASPASADAASQELAAARSDVGTTEAPPPLAAGQAAGGDAGAAAQLGQSDRESGGSGDDGGAVAAAARPQAAPRLLTMDERRAAWEDYSMDYTGGDGFDFVLQALQSKLAVSARGSDNAETRPEPTDEEQRTASPLLASLELLQPGRGLAPILTTRRAGVDEHRAMWEQGQIDYHGVDRFDNILKQLESRLTTGSEAAVHAKARPPLRPPLPKVIVTSSSHSAGDAPPSATSGGSPPRVTLTSAEPSSPKVVLSTFPYHWC